MQLEGPVDSFVEGSSRFSFAQSSYPFLGRHARYFKVRVSDAGKRWLRASVEAKSFVPSVLILDPVKQVIIGDGWYERRRRESQHIARVEGDEVEVIVSATSTDLKAQAAALGDFVLSADFHHADPSLGVMAKSRDFLSDPFVGLAAGIFVGAVLSYFFYKRSIARRTVLYALVLDRTVLHYEQTRASRLKVMRGDKAVLEHVGACSVTIRFKGLRDLRKEDIIEPIRLGFNKITSILRATADATPGWGKIVLRDDSKSIEVPVEHLKSGDRLQLDVFYTQKDLSAVEVRESGRFVDGDILPDRDNLHRWRTRIAVSIFAVYLLAILVAAFDVWIFQLPMGIARLTADILAAPSWWLVGLGCMFWVLSEREILNWLAKVWQRATGTKDLTSVHFEAEPHTLE